MARKDDVRDEQRRTAERQRMVDQLTEADIKEIDEDLLDNVSSEWSKVSRIVLTTMIEREDGVTGLPETFYTGRIARLVKEGLLEARGDLSDMHLSEVRLLPMK